MSKYENMPDEQLIRKLREGETAIMDYIISKYKHVVIRAAKAMYLLGGENDDLIQEGMIGLFKAVRDFDINQETSFYSFAELCISRQMYTAIKLSQRQKHMPLNSYISLYDIKKTASEDKQSPLIEQLEMETNNNPEELFIDKERMLMLVHELNERLSDMERRVLHLHLQGEDYRAIAELLDKSPKSIDNALQRIRQKMRTILE
ncbi:MAG: RNA polymerase sporulation sigma factor SigH [Faecalimonas sp.]|nr:RNA polymerase sporulation sigma factor SigH [Faecalimonas sp.]